MLLFLAQATTLVIHLAQLATTFGAAHHANVSCLWWPTYHLSPHGVWETVTTHLNCTISKTVRAGS